MTNKPTEEVKLLMRLHQNMSDFTNSSLQRDEVSSDKVAKFLTTLQDKISKQVRHA